MTMKHFICWVFIGFQTSILLAQASSEHTAPLSVFEKAERLFENQKYSAAQENFVLYTQHVTDKHTPLYEDAVYYQAICALKLYRPNALNLLKGFISDYPESNRVSQIYFDLGRYYHRKKKYKDCIVWFEKLNNYQIKTNQHVEYHFKLGYAHFRKKNWSEARNHFFEIKDSADAYAAPALYYYSHIEYNNKHYEEALKGFLKLGKQANFAKLVPYYITQIYYLQGKMDQVIAYAEQENLKVSDKNESKMAKLVGDAYYRTEDYEKSIPYFEKYGLKNKLSRVENYQLAFANQQVNRYQKAIKYYNKTLSPNDAEAQLSRYNIANCYLKSGNKEGAMKAFETVAMQEADVELQKDALYNTEQVLLVEKT